MNKNSDGNSEGLAVGLKEGLTLVCFDIKMLVIDDFSKLGEEIGLTWTEVWHQSWW